MRAVVISRPRTEWSPAVYAPWGSQTDRYFIVATADGQRVAVQTGKNIPASTSAGTEGELVWVPLNGKPDGKILRPRFRPDLCRCGGWIHAEGKCVDCLIGELETVGTV